MGKAGQFREVPREGVEAWGPGEEPDGWEPGDILLTHGGTLFSRIIRVSQRLRIHGDDRRYTHWNHAALVASPEGDLIEVQKPGVVRTHASKYRDQDVRLVKVQAAGEDRRQIMAFAEWALEHHRGFGRVTILSILFTLVTGGKFSFFVDGTEICSGFVARAQERSGAIFSRQPSHIMPADLAKYYRVDLATS